MCDRLSSNNAARLPQARRELVPFALFFFQQEGCCTVFSTHLRGDSRKYISSWAMIRTRLLMRSVSAQRCNAGARRMATEKETRPSMVTSTEIMTLLQQVPFGAGLGLHQNLIVEELGWGQATFRLKCSDEFDRPGGTISGPVMFTLADLTMWSLVQTTRGLCPLAVTTNATLNFLSKPKMGCDLVCYGRMLKNGKRLCTGSIEIVSAEDLSTVVASALVSYSVPPASRL